MTNQYSYKVSLVGNYIKFISNDIPTVFNEFQGRCTDIRVVPSTVYKDSYDIYGVNGVKEKWATLPITNILKSDGSAYTKVEWEAFYTDNTGV